MGEFDETPIRELSTVLRYRSDPCDPDSEFTPAESTSAKTTPSVGGKTSIEGEPWTVWVTLLGPSTGTGEWDISGCPPPSRQWTPPATGPPKSSPVYTSSLQGNSAYPSHQLQTSVEPLANRIVFSVAELPGPNVDGPDQTPPPTRTESKPRTG